MRALGSPIDVLLVALYTLTGGKLNQGLMVQTVADRLGLTFEQAEEIAAQAAKARLVRHQVHTVTLTGDGFMRAVALYGKVSASVSGGASAGRTSARGRRLGSRRARPRRQ